MKRQFQADPLTINGLKRWSFYFTAVVVTFTGIIVAVVMLILIGWQWDIAALKNPLPGLSVMNPVTALAFLLSGLSLLALTPRHRSNWRTAIGIFLACLVLAIGLLRFSSQFFPGLWRVDYMLYPSRIFLSGADHSANPMVMVPAAAVTFIFSGLALLILPLLRRYASTGLQILAIAIGLISVFTLICYLYKVKEFNRAASTTPMAVESAICFLLLSLALLLSLPGKGIMRQITGPFSGSVMSRRLLPFALLVPVALGWVRLYSQWNGTFTVEHSVAILVIHIILCWLAFILYNTVLLNRRDLANRKVRQALLASEERFRLLVGSVKDYAIAMLDPAGRFVSWNEGAQAITGYPAEEIIGQPNSIFYTREEIEAGIPGAYLRRASELGQFHREGWQTRKDGSRYWAEVAATAIHTGNGQLKGFAVIVRDMTERRRAQEKIAYQARLMEDISDAVFSIDTDFRMVSWNKAAETLYGYTADEVIGKPIRDIISGPVNDIDRAVIRGEMETLGYWKGDVVYATKDGVPVDISVSLSCTRDAQGKIDGYIMVCRDMTERLRAEARLKKFNEELERQVEEKTVELVRSNTELRELTCRLQDVREEERATIAREIHDELGQLLTGLKMDLFWVGKRLDARTPEPVTRKLHSAMSLLDMTIHTVRRISTDLRPSILDVLGLVAAIEWQSREFEKRTGIPTSFRSEVPELDFPPDMAIGLFRICQESLTNVARHAAASHVDITLDNFGDSIRLAVVDDGKGLVLPMSATRKTFGLLGMKERAQMMGGTLEISNGEKKGLQLTATIPVKPVPVRSGRYDPNA